MPRVDRASASRSVPRTWPATASATTSCVSPYRVRTAPLAVPGCAARASSRCSVPIQSWCSARASSWAATTVSRASVVKRSNMSVLPPERPAAARVLLVHCLPGDAQELGDLVPRPALLAGVADLEGLQALDERPQRTDG